MNEAISSPLVNSLVAVVALSGALVLIGLLAFNGQRVMLARRLNPSVRYRIPDRRTELSHALAALRERLFASRMHRVSLRQLAELGDCLLLLERLFQSGDSVIGALEWLGARTNGVLGQRIRLLVGRVEAGAAIAKELSSWQAEARSRQEQEMAAKLLAAVQQGSDIVAVIRGLRESVDGHIRAKRIANLGRSETRMLVPLVFLVLPITVLFAVYPSLSLLNASLG